MSHLSVQDAHQILEIFEGASPDEIKNAYRILALKWHPDRHHNSHDKETSTRHFLEVTNAYRTLVRVGFTNPQNPNMFKSRNPPPPVRRPPPLAHQTSSDSSISLDSFVHMVASSTESHTTAPPSHRESPRTSWKQGVRQPSETKASQYGNGPVTPRIFSYEAPSKADGSGPAVYRPPTPFAPIPPKPESIKVRTANPSIGRPKKHDPSPHVSSLFPGRRYQQTIFHVNQLPRLFPEPQIRTPSFREFSGPKFHLPPYNIPLMSLGLGPSGEWVYSLSMTFEEIFSGKHFRFAISRMYLSGRTKSVVIEIDIPVGCRPGTRILCRNVGHEWKSGVFQDLAFIIEETPHDRFIRIFDDLVMDIRLPWVESLRRQGGKVPFMGIDGKSLMVQIDYPKDRSLTGRSIIKGAGMPVREHGQVVGRGNLIIQWEILPPKPKIFHFMRRLWGGK